MNRLLHSTSLVIRLAIGALVIGSGLLLAPCAAFPQEKDGPKHPPVLTPRETIVDPKDKDKEEPNAPLLTCGKCPKGYVATAVAVPRVGLELGAPFDLSEMCKGLFKHEEEGVTVVECKPIGFQNQMPVCGTCLEGYREVGRTYLPALCGNEDGGLRTQCQVPNMEGGMPDPTQGGRRCPPDCVGNLPTPGQGNMLPPPKIPSIEIRKEKQEEAP